MMKFGCSALAFALAAWSGAVTAQDAAPPLISLTPTEWRCLGQRLDGYLAAGVDPVLASVLGCVQSVVQPAPPPLRRDPLIAPRVGTGPQSDPDAARKVFVLTLSQVRCLKDALPRLVPSDTQGIGGAAAPPEKRVEFRLASCQSGTR
jgi:hypothetical protein